MSEEGKWQRIGIVGVDTGTVLLSDPCSVQAGFDVDPLWEGLGLKDSLQVNYEKGHPGRAVIVSNFGGDGMFPVFIRKDAEGMVVEMKIVFNEEDL
jgi:hypothetical protein